MGERRTLARAVIVGALAALLGRGPSLLPRTKEDQTLISAGAALMGAAVAAVTDEVVVQVGRRAGGRTRVSALLAAGGVTGWLWASRRRRRDRFVDAAETASFVAAAGAGAGEVGAIVYPRLPLVARGLPVLLGARLAVKAASGLLALRRAIAEPGDRIKASVTYPYLPTASGGDESLVSRKRLDREGRKFLGLTTAADAIEAVMGPPAQDPIRVYVGLASAATAEERVSMAVDELERLGGFERARILVAIPTGSGFVNPVFLEAEEHMSRGDVATVAVQYSHERSVRALKAVPAAAETYRALLETIRDRLAKGQGRRPEVAVYGESLGAWIAAEIAARGLVVMDALGVDRAVLLGIPFFGADKLVRLRAAVGALPPTVGVFRTAEDMAALGEDERAHLRYVVVSHPEDPVANYSGALLLWRRPPWLVHGAVDPRVPARMRWFPGVTFLQVAFDVKNGTTFTPVFEVKAHDYRAEHPAVVRIALGHRDVSDEQLAAVAARTAETARAQKERELAARSPR